jgi:hypothetical protein
MSDEIQKLQDLPLDFSQEYTFEQGWPPSKKELLERVCAWDHDVIPELVASIRDSKIVVEAPSWANAVSTVLMGQAMRLFDAPPEIPEEESSFWLRAERECRQASLPLYEWLTFKDGDPKWDDCGPYHRISPGAETTVCGRSTKNWKGALVGRPPSRICKSCRRKLAGGRS